MDTDAVYQDFVLDPPKDSFFCKTSYKDNLWLSNESIQKIEAFRSGETKTKPHDF